jgi:hypothetical protein
MTFNLFGSPSRPTPVPVSVPSDVGVTNKISNTVVTPTPIVQEVDAHVVTANKMKKIRKALQAQQAMEDTLTAQKYKSKLLEINTSRTNTESSTPSPKRRHHFDMEHSTFMSQPYYCDIEAEKKDDDYDNRSNFDSYDDDEDDEQHKSMANTILYNDGATELFKCIEEGMWHRATALLQERPEQASIWILSTGTMNTTFNWSKWKRLPLHEAARRQPPIEFMTQLVATYPDAMKAVTQFGELPLHLAVECGASPAVVNLLAVSHWRGCHATDQSGRTPFEVLQENDSLLDPIEHKAVVDALQASAVAYEQILAEHADEIQQLHDENAIGLEAVREQHDDDLLEEQEKQDKLLQQVASLQQQLTVANSVIARQQVELHTVKANDQFWKDRVEELQIRNATLLDKYIREQTVVVDLRQQVSERDQQAIVLADRIVDLQTCIHRMAHWHQTTVRTQLETVTKSFAIATNDLLSFQSTLHDHSDDLQTLLVDMGVPDDTEYIVTAPTTSTNTDDTIQKQQSKDMIDHHPNDDSIVEYGEDAFDVEDDDETLVSRAALSASKCCSSLNK